MNKRGMIANLIGGFVAIVIGLALFPVITKEINSMQEQRPGSSMYNVTGYTGGFLSSEMMGLVPTLFAIVVVVMGVVIILNGLKTAGLIGGHKVKQEDNKEKELIKWTCASKSAGNKKEDEEVSTLIISKDKEGNKKLNIKLEPGYHVNQYALDVPSEGAPLTLNEDTFKKTKYD